LLEELGLDYTIEFYRRQPSLRAPADLRAIHPLGKSPIIVDGDKTITESGAIAEYLVDSYGNRRLVPTIGTKERLQYTYCLHYAEGSLMPPLLVQLLAGQIAGPQVPWFAPPVARGASPPPLRDRFIDPEIELHLDFIEGELAESPYFCGSDLTAADIQKSFPLEAAAARGGLNQSRPKTWDWLNRIHARPAYRRALEKGGAYELLR
jgi:glutathione S-transferase